MSYFEDAGYTVGPTLRERLDCSLYRAVDQSTGSEVVLRAQWHDALPRAVEFAMREQHLLPLLSRHPGIVPVLNTTVLPNGVRLVVTPWYSQGSLADRPPPERDEEDWPTAIHAVLGIVDALDYAQRLGVFHGDLRAHWLMVDGDAVRLNGFGAAREAFVERFGPEQFVGKNPGLPPELVASEAGTVFGLAALTAEIAWGGPVFGQADVRHVWTVEDFECYGAPPAIATLLERAVDLDPRRRPTIGEFAAALKDAAHADGVSVTLGPEPVELPVAHRVPEAHWPMTPFSPKLGVELPFGWRVQDTVELRSPLGSAKSVARHLAADHTLPLEELAQRLRPGPDSPYGPSPSPTHSAGPPPAPGMQTEPARLDDGTEAVRARWRGAGDGHIGFLVAEPLPQRVVTVTGAVAPSAQPAIGLVLERAGRGVALAAPDLTPGATPGTFSRRSGLSVPVPDGWDVDEQAWLIDHGGHEVVKVTVHRNPHGRRNLDTLDRELLEGQAPFWRGYRERWVEQRTVPALGTANLRAFDWQPIMASPTTTIRLVALSSPDHALEAQADLPTAEFEARSPEVLQILLSLSYDAPHAPLVALRDAEQDATAEAVAAYVAIAPDPRWTYDVDARTTPAPMWHGEIDRDGMVGWAPMPSTVTTDELDALEAELGIQLPSSYRRLLLTAHLEDLEIHDVRFPARLPGTWAAKLRAERSALAHGILPVADVDLEEWDFRQNTGKFCFSLRWRDADGDCPVFIDDASGRHWTFSSGTAMLGSFAVLADCDVNPISHGGPDLERFLAADPRHTEQTRAWWRSFSQPPR